MDIILYGYNSTIREYNTLVDKYNANLEELDELVDVLNCMYDSVPPGSAYATMPPT